MPLATIVFGLILMVASIGTYASADEPELIGLLPAVLGLLALGCGVAALIKKNLRMHLMHAAVLLALAGVLVPLWLLISFLATELQGDQGLKLIRIFVTVTVSGLYLFAAIQTFVAARRKRKVEKVTGKTETD
ncbi:hypothetical protein OT109_12580 [Phycisphaeraceae bacterium D3-23]